MINYLICVRINKNCELDEISTCREFRQVRKEGNREVTGEIPFYNLDTINQLGHRVKIDTIAIK